MGPGQVLAILTSGFRDWGTEILSDVPKLVQSRRRQVKPPEFSSLLSYLLMCLGVFGLQCLLGRAEDLVVEDSVQVPAPLPAS